MRPQFRHRGNLTLVKALGNGSDTDWWGKGDYAEASRKYRRTEFKHEDWVKHRSSGRFFENLATIFESGIGQNLKKELTVVSSAAAFVILLNCLTGEYSGLDGMMHTGPLSAIGDQIGPISLPSMPFATGLPALSLLLVFRTNSGYNRWSEARTVWGGIINQCRNVARQVVNYFPQDAQGNKVRDIMIALTGAYSKSLRNFLRTPDDCLTDGEMMPEECLIDDDDAFRAELLQYAADGLMTQEQINACMATQNRPMFLLGALSHNLKKVELNQYDRARIDASISALVQYTGDCERIFKSPVPLVYTRHTARFLGVFLALLPLGLWDATAASWNHIATLPAEYVLAFFLLGIEEIGMQIEEPFSILPLDAFNKVDISVTMDELVAAKDMSVWNMDLPEEVG